MIKKLFILFAACIYMNNLSAQNDPMKVLQEAQRKLDSVMKNNPAIKKYSNKDSNAVNIPAIPVNISPVSAFIKSPDTNFLSRIKLPPRNIKALATIPAKTMTKQELINFIADLRTKIKPALQKYYNTEDVNVSSLGSTGASNASVLSWYKGRPDVSLEIALDAANINPDDLTALSNLSGVLDLCGFSYKAIPILKYIKEKIPDNPTVDNNLGQAYIRMGDAQNAADYLKQAIAGSPEHPNANFTMAIISYAQGDKNAAKKYCENSLRGGFIPNAWNMLLSIDRKVKMMDYIRNRYKAPEIFNEHHFELLPQCRRADQVRSLQQKYADYKKMILAAKSKYEKMEKQEEKFVRDSTIKKMQEKIAAKKDPLRPFGWFANVVLGDIAKTHEENVLKLKEYDKNEVAQRKVLFDDYMAKKKAIDEKYNQDEDKVGEGMEVDESKSAQRCNEVNALANQYLPKFAEIREQRQKKWIYEERQYFNDFAFWLYMASPDDHYYKQNFYKLVGDYLSLLEDLNRSTFLACVRNQDTTYEKNKLEETREGNCPLNAEIPIANLGKEGEKFEGFIGKINLDCEGMGFELGEGLIFNFDRKFSTGETTLAFGGGVSEHIPYVPIIEGGAKMQFYITFGGATAWDIGVKWEAEMDIKGMYHPEQKAGWTLGINSGMDTHFDTFSEGEIPSALSDRLGKELFGLEPVAPQQNPNIKMYNNNNKHE